MVIKEIRKTKYGYNILVNDEKINLETIVFSKYKIRKGQSFESKVWQQILKENEEEFIKRKSLTYLARRRSTKEFVTYLFKLKTPKELISSLVEDYTKKGYLDDYLYAELLIDKEEKRYGKRRLREILTKKGIKNEVIDSLLENHVDKNLEPQIKKACKNVKADNYSMAREKLIRSFTSKGYNLKEVSELIETYLDENNFNEDVTIKKHYLKALNRYQRQYDGAELNLKIKQALYRKGFKMNLIDKVIRGE